MKRKQAQFNNAAAKATVVREETEVEEKETYDLSTPLWSKYYRQVRKSIRFPRYYKRALNW